MSLKHNYIVVFFYLYDHKKPQKKNRKKTKTSQRLESVRERKRW